MTQTKREKSEPQVIEVNWDVKLTLKSNTLIVFKEHAPLTLNLFYDFKKINLI